MKMNKLIAESTDELGCHILGNMRYIKAHNRYGTIDRKRDSTF